MREEGRLSVSAERLYAWRDACAELDRLTHSIRSDEDKKRARQLIDHLERELTQAYLDANAAEVRCACKADTVEPTTIELEAAQ